MDTKQVIRRKVVDMFCSKGFCNVDIQFESAPASGGGVHGIMLSAKICAVKDEMPQEIHAIIKCAPSNENTRQALPVKNLFQREILFYTKIVPIYDNLQDQFELCMPQEMRCFLPKCYGCCEDFKQEIIILEDLNKKGFCVMPLDNLDYAHAAIIFQTIGKLHALSFIYKDSYPKRFKEMADQCIDDSLKPNDENDVTCLLLYGEKVMGQFTHAISDMSLRKRCELALGTNAVKKFMDIQKIGKVKTIQHGDSWIGNYMFKYKNDKPTEAVPIDFQWSRYGSIAYDFMYFFSFSVTGELRKNRFHQLIDEYYSGFKGFLTVCGYDANKYCSYEQFKEELGSQALISLVTFMITYPLFKHPGFILQELLATPELLSVTEDYKLCVDDLLTVWVKLGFI